jgi:hypothetical protein
MVHDLRSFLGYATPRGLVMPDDVRHQVPGGLRPGGDARGWVEAAAIGQPVVDAYIVHRQEETAVGATTIRRELSTLTKMLRLAYERLPILHEPKEGPARVGFFDRHQIASPGDLQDVVRKLAGTFQVRRVVLP